MTTNNVVSIAQCKRALLDCLTHDPSSFRPLLQGAPGTAKTSLVEQVADVLGYKCQTIILSQMTPEHITGYPYIEDGVMKYSRPDWFPTGGKILLFADEIGQCPMATQNVAMQLIHERRVGPHVLPADCIVIGAGNRAEDRAGSTVMQTALRTRFFPVYTVEPTKEEWVDHAKESDFNAFVIAYVQAIRSDVLEFDPREKGGFVSPRTLEQAGKMMTAFGDNGDNPDLAAGLYGILGSGAASEFLAYIKTIAKMPSYDDIRNDPMGAPTAPDMVDAIARMLRGNARYGHMSKVIRYIKRYDAESQTRLVSGLAGPNQGHPDVVELRKTLNLDD